jgi:hypothetical protein
MKAALLVLVAGCAVSAPETPVTPQTFIGTDGRLLRDLDVAALVGNPLALQTLGAPYRVGPCLPIVCAAVGPILVVARPPASRSRSRRAPRTQKRWHGSR